MNYFKKIFELDLKEVEAFIENHVNFCQPKGVAASVFASAT